jgi:transposase
MWKPEHRRAADRHSLRYPSELSDSEWALIEPAIPPAKRGGRRREVNVREVLNAIFYVLSTGCQWQALPKDLPPKSTAHSYFMLWDWDGTLERIHHALYVETREREGREVSPTAAIIDSQSAKGAQKGAARSTRKGLSGQKDHRTQAPYPGRYARPSAERRRSSRRYSGPRRSAAGPRSTHPLSLPLHRAHLRRCRLSGTARRASGCQQRSLGVRDRQAQRTA